jgi:hypothetical protein
MVGVAQYSMLAVTIAPEMDESGLRAMVAMAGDLLSAV